MPEPPSGDRVPDSDSQRDARSQDQTRAYNISDLYWGDHNIDQTTILPNHFPTQHIDNSAVWTYSGENCNLQYPNSNDDEQTLNLPKTPQTREPQGKAEQPYVSSLQPQKTSVPNVATYLPRLLVMPAPNNESPAQERTLSPSAPAYPASTSSIGSPNKNHKVKMEAARMEVGLLRCAHADCLNEPKVFKRRCEYT